MITLIGHGYIGEYISKELNSQQIKHTWIHHNEAMPIGTTAIINAAGYTGVPNVDACERNRQATIQGNVIYPLALEELHPDTPIVHITSGCVYTGYTTGGWTEEHEPNFNFDNGSFYSGSKALFQRLMTPYLNKSYLLRIRMPFGCDAQSKNLLTKLRSYERLIDCRNSLSLVTDVARVAVHFAVSRPAAGIYNVCNPGSVTTRDIANMMGLTKSWFTDSEFAAAVVAPRSNCVLSTKKLESVFPIQHVEDALVSAINGLAT